MYYFCLLTLVSHGILDFRLAALGENNGLQHAAVAEVQFLQFRKATEVYCL